MTRLPSWDEISARFGGSTAVAEPQRLPSSWDEISEVFSQPAAEDAPFESPYADRLREERQQPTQRPLREGLDFATSGTVQRPQEQTWSEWLNPPLPQANVVQPVEGGGQGLVVGQQVEEIQQRAAEQAAYQARPAAVVPRLSEWLAGNGPRPKPGDVYLDNEGRFRRSAPDTPQDMVGVADDVLTIDQLNREQPEFNWGESRAATMAEAFDSARKQALASDERMSELTGQKREALDYWNEKLPFAGSAYVMAEQLALRPTLQRIAKGEGTTQDYEKAGAYVAELEKQGGKEWWKKAGDIVAEMPAFMIELSATGGMGAVSKQTGKTLLRKAGDLAVRNTATAALMPQRVARAAVDQSMPEQLPGANFSEGSDDWVRNTVRGYIDTYIETGTEQLGEGMSKLPGLKQIKDFMASKVGSGAVSKALKAGGFDGLIEESLEERAGEIARGALEYGPEYTRLGEDFGATGDIVSGDPERMLQGVGQLGMEATAFSVPGAARRIGDAIQQRFQQQKPDIAAEARKWATTHDNPETVFKVGALAENETVSRGAFEEAVGGPMRIGDRKLSQEERTAFSRAVRDTLAEVQDDGGSSETQGGGRGPTEGTERVNGETVSSQDQAGTQTGGVNDDSEQGSGVVGPNAGVVSGRPDTGGGRAPEHGGTGVGGLGERSPAEVEQVWRATVPGAAGVKFAPGKSEMLRQIQESQGASDVGPVDGSGAGIQGDELVESRPVSRPADATESGHVADHSHTEQSGRVEPNQQQAVQQDSPAPEAPDSEPGGAQGAVAEPKSEEEYAAIPMYSVYKTNHRGQEKFAVKQFENKGFGDSLFDSVEDATQQSTREIERAAEDARRVASQQEAAQKQADDQKSHEDSFRGFLSDDAMRKGRQLKTLAGQINYRGEMLTKKELVERKIAEGYRVTDDDRLQSPDGSFLDAKQITKTGIDYARHLQAQPTTEADQPTGAPQVVADSVTDDTRPVGEPDVVTQATSAIASIDTSTRDGEFEAMTKVAEIADANGINPNELWRDVYFEPDGADRDIVVAEKPQPKKAILKRKPTPLETREQIKQAYEKGEINPQQVLDALSGRPADAVGTSRTPSGESGVIPESVRDDAAPVTEREPWQMTREEYLEGKTDVDAKAIAQSAHANHVKNAVAAGQPVPANVLEGYKSNGWAKTALEKQVTPPKAGLLKRPKEPNAQTDTGSQQVGGTQETQDVQPNVEVETGATEKAPVTPQTALASRISEAVGKGPLDAKAMFKLADESYGKSRTEGGYGPSEAYDALETGVNQHIANTKQHNPSADANTAKQSIQSLRQLVDSVPSQTNRSGTKDKLQQFSTPPDYAYAVNWLANISPSDTMLEPSAGTGSIAVHAVNAGAKVYANEIEMLPDGTRNSRPDLIRSIPGIQQVFVENAEQIHNILPGKMPRPSVVVMNPPFSRSILTSKKTSGVDRKHIDSAMKLLEDNGRLVAIIGAGLHGETKGLTDWLAKSPYNVRANVELARDVYKGYGTSFPTRVLVIDKAPKAGAVVTGKAENLSELVDLLEGVRNDRPKQQPTQSTGEATPSGRKGGSKPRPPVQPTTGGVGIDESSEGTAGTGATVRTGTIGERPADVPVASQGSDAGVSESGGTGVVSGVGQKPRVPTEGTTDQTRSSDDGGTAVDKSPKVSTGTKGKLKVTKPVRKKRTGPKKLTESTYEPYEPRKFSVEGAKPHPASIVESAAMSAIDPPDVSYSPSIPQSVVESGDLSELQLEAVAYAGQSHQQEIEIDGKKYRKGFMLGDGTGVGKGREIAGIITDNQRQGRKRAVWVSVDSGELFRQAKSDIEGVGGNKDDLFLQNKAASGHTLPNRDGILFTTYGTLVTKASEKAAKEGNTKSRVDQIVDWLGDDFDGVIAFDESHKMGSAMEVEGGRGSKKMSETASAGLELQQRLPNARVVYISATSATEIHNLGYADRLGLWGKGTPFASKSEFVNKIGEGGVAAMEKVAADMKAMGVYISRNISFNDGTEKGRVEYDRIEHTLTEDQTAQWNRMSEAWLGVMENMNEALKETGADGRARGAAESAFWGANQRFWNQIITAMQTPAMMNQIDKDLKDGKSVIVQLTNTNEAAQKRALAGMSKDDSLESVDVSPKQILIDYVESSFPVMEYEEYEDDNGNTKIRLVTDANGKPVQNAAAVALREELLDDLGSIQIGGESPIDSLINRFGADMVAEVTGRSERIVKGSDGKPQREKRTKTAKKADIQAFQNGTKRILVFSEAGGTGASYHASLAAKNQQKRHHYLLQAGWKANAAIQGLGRSHRSNQAQAPTYFLVTTNLKGQKRFISTIARRLSQLGALTKGQRSAGESGVFSAADNLESTEAAEALRTFFKDLYHGAVEGMTIESFEEKTGLRLRNDKDGSLKADLPTISRFLNRVLNLDVATQNNVFDQFDNRLKEKVAIAEAAGTLDQGMETVHADKITKTDDRVVYRHESGAETRYVKATIENRAKPVAWQALNDGRDIERFVHRKKAGDVVALERTGTSEFNPKTGALETKVRIHTPMGYTISTLEKFSNDKYYETRTPKAAEAAWNQQVKDVPEFAKREEHLLTGVLLPIWDRIKGRPRVVRMMTSEGETLLGRIIDPNEVNETLRKLGAEENRPDMSAEDAVDRLLRNEITLELANGWTVKRSRVQNENRIELVGPSFTNNKQLDADGVFRERIASNTRYFVPTGDTSADVLGKVIEANPIVDVKTLKQEDETSAFAIDDTKQKFSAQRKNNAEPIGNADIIKTWERDFEVPIRRGKVGSKKGVQGIYKHLVEVVRLRNSEDVNLRVASHEVAHHVDQKTDAVKSMSAATKEVFGKLDYDSLLNRPKEGFAEFVSRYVMGEDVQVEYPQAYQWFSTQWAPANPEMAAKLGKAARHAQQYADQGAFARAKMLFPGRSPAPVDVLADDYKQAMQSFYNRSVASMVDQNRAFYLLDKEFEKAGGKFRNRESTYDLKLATDFTAPAHAERAMLEGVHTVSQRHQIIGPSLADALKDIKSYDDYQRAQAYAVALFTVEMADVQPGYNTGMRLDDAEFIIAEVEKNTDELKRYNHFADTLTAYNNALVEMAYDAGSITRKDMKAILGKTKHYVPLHREVGGKRAKRGLMAGAGLANLPPAFRRRSMEGSGIPVVDIVEASMRRTMDQYARAMKQQVVHSIVTTVNPKLNGGVKGLGKLAELIPPDMRSNVLRINEALDDLVEEGLIDADTAKEVKIVSSLRQGKIPSDKNIKWIADRYGVEVDSDTLIEDLLFATEDVADGEGLITYWRPSYLPNAGKNIVRLVVNGEPQLYQLDDVLFEAMDSMGQVELGAFGEGVKAFNHAFKTGAVGLSTGFGAANLVRDWWDAQAHSTNQGVESIWMPMAMLGKYAYAEVESLRSGGKPSNEFVRLFKEYGGELTTRLGYDKKSQGREKRKLFGGASKTSYLLDHPVQSLVSAPGKGLRAAEQLITMTDVGPRLAEFVAVMKKNGYRLNENGQVVNKRGEVERPPRHVIVKAINAAGDATVNFKRVGRTMRKIDAYIPFTNAALQSRVRQVMAYKSLGKGLGDREAQRIAIMTLAFGALGYAAWLAHQDDDDNEERARWLKGSHFVLFNNSVRLPKSRDYRAVTNMTEALLEELVSGKKGKVKEQFVDEAKEMMIGGGGVLREAFEQTANYDEFRQRPIETQTDARLHPWARFDDHTSLPAKHLGNITGHLFGMSPKRIDHLLDSTTGGMYRRWNRLGQHLLNGELDAKDIPGVNAFWMDKDYHQSLGDFYDAKWEAEQDVNTAKKLGDDTKAAKVTSKTLDDYEAMMTDIRASEGEEPTGENEKYIIGLARAALGREPLEKYPNPLEADPSDLTPSVAGVIAEYIEELQDTAYGMTKEKYPKPKGMPQRTAKDTNETYEARYNAWLDARTSAHETLQKRQGMLKRK